MTQTKKILLIGRSGRGKSTLANVLLNKNNNFEEVFKESSRSVSETKKIQFEQFEDNNTNYLVIDTPGIGDTKMSDSEVLDIIAEAVYRAKDGISQVLFVVGGRFDQSEMATYNLLRTIIFDEYITKHTTIARTRFANFRSGKECQEDIRLMREAAQEKKSELENQIADNEKKMQSISSHDEQYQKLLIETEKLKKELKSTLSEIIESCQGRVVHVDNPPVGIRGISEEDSKSNKKKRGKSREKVLKHLNKNCQEDYNPEKLQKLSNEIANDYFQYLEKKEELEAELEKLRSDSTSPGKKLSKEKDSKDKKKLRENISSESISNEPSTGRTEKELVEEDNQKTSDKLVIGEKIAQLENKKGRLRKEIAEKERIIRQKVLKHIFSNYGDISNELGGDVFLNSVIGDHNWEKISQRFSNKELVVKWLSKEFDYEQVQKWAIVLGNNFNPEYDVSFCAWLRDDKQLTVEKIKELSHIFDIEQLKQEYIDRLEKETNLLEKHNEQLDSEEKPVQEWLDKYYPEEKRKEIKELDLSNKNLANSLFLRDWPQLVKINCAGNKLTSLFLDNCPNLKMVTAGSNCLTNIIINNCEGINDLRVYANSLTDLNFLNSLNPNKLTTLTIANNKFPEQDLTVFGKFVNCEKLWISHNPFFGSLAPLQSLKKLKWLNIKDTRIDNGLECLPESLESLYCTGQLAEELKDYSERGVLSKNCFRYRDWRQDYLKWKANGFSTEEIKKWTKTDLSLQELDVALCLKKQGYTPETYSLVKDKSQFHPPQKGGRLSKSLADNYKEEDQKEKRLIGIQLPLKDISSKYWDKVEVANDWDREYQVDKNESIPMMENGHSGHQQYNLPLHPNDKRFKNLSILIGFKKFTNDTEKFYHLSQSLSQSNDLYFKLIKDIKITDWFDISDPHGVTKCLRDANKLFIKDGYGKVVSQEAFEFLQSIIESQEIMAIVKLTQEELEEFKKDDQQLWAQVEFFPK